MSLTGQDKDVSGGRPEAGCEEGWRYQFGSFFFDPDLHELRDGSEAVRLRPQAASLLELLLANSGRIVTREEIRDSIWRPDMVVDFDLGISACIKQIRHLLRDSARSPEYIETVPRRGYRIIADVRRIPKSGDVSMGAPVSGDDPRNQKKPRWRFRRPNGFSALAVAVVIAASIFGVAWHALTPDMSPREVVAILPLDNYSVSSQEADTLAMTITERLIGELGPVAPDRLAVIGKTSTIAYDGQDMTAGELGARLGADYIVEGSIREIEEGWVASIHLIRCLDESYVWGKLVETDTANVNQSARIITSELSGALSDTLVPEDESNSRKIAVEDDQDD